MLICMHYLNDAYTKLKNLQDKLEKEIEILRKREINEQEGKTNKERNNLNVHEVINSCNNAFLDLAMVVEESRYLQNCDVSPLMALQVLLPIIKTRLESVETVHDLYATLKMVTGPLESWMERKVYDRISFYDYAYAHRNFWMATYTSHDSLPPYIVQKLSTAIQWRKDNVNIFEMFCRNTNFLQNITQDKDNVKVFGLDSEDNIGTYTPVKYHRLIHGSLKGSFITNSCFDLIVCVPPITVNRELKAGSYQKKERELLFKAADYLRPDGWLLYVIPYYRFYTEICVHLVKTYHNFQIFTDSQNDGAVYVLCQKRNIALQIDSIDMKQYSFLRNLPFNYYDLEKSPDIKPIKLPDRSEEVKRFRGSKLNEQELAEMHNASKCTAMFWKEQQVEKFNETKSRPLLPFNIGQLGLILTSGCLDGIVDEGNGFCHAVKGRVVKKTDTVENIDTHTHQVQVVNTINNRVEISVFLPDGTYKCLA